MLPETITLLRYEEPVIVSSVAIIRVDVKLVIVPVVAVKTPIVVDGMVVILAVAMFAVVEDKLAIVPEVADKEDTEAEVDVNEGADKEVIVAVGANKPPVASNVPIKVVPPTTVKPSNPNIAP
jgi:hypothetical protein